MALSTQPYKGARDFYPEDKRLQKYVFSIWRKVSERFGYEEYDAPLLEPVELYLAKTGEEIVNEQTYAFTDRGGRQVAIRPEMTPSVSRMVAGRRQELAYPARWFNIGNRWRYERPQRGRTREFFQLDVDVFGLSGLEAEYEIVQIADGIMQEFGAKRDMYSIRINSRVLMDYVMHDYLHLDGTQMHTAAKLIDKMNKLDHPEFEAQLNAIFSPSQRELGGPDKLRSALRAKGLDELPDEVKAHESAGRLRKLLELLEATKITNVTFDLSIMRGFDYYTDIVFEVFDASPENKRSMFGGGRYDGLVGLFGVEPVPTVGFAVGDVTLSNFLETHKLLPELSHEADLFVVLIGDIYERAQAPITELREMGLNVAVDSTGRKADKQIKSALKLGIRYALFIGENELASEQYILKDLKTGEEEKHGLQRVVSIALDYRRK